MKKINVKRLDESRDHSWCRCNCPIVGDYPIPSGVPEGARLHVDDKVYTLDSFHRWILEDKE